MGSTHTPSAATSELSLDVAIIGSGIVGVMTALGLYRRGLRVTIYERATQHADTGAAFGVTAVGRESMKRVHPKITEALERVGGRDPSTMVQYWDGFGPRTKEAAENPETGLMFEAPEKHLGFVACMRTQLLLEMVKELPEGVVRFNKQFVGFTDRFEDGNAKVVLSFADGTFAEADVVIGCGGVHSALRSALFGGDHPAAKARYTHKTAYRAQVPLAGAAAALGVPKASRTMNHSGPGGYVVSFPLPALKVYNIHLYVYDEGEWPYERSSLVPSSRDEALKALEGWGPHMRELVSLLPDQIAKYAIFDMYDHPAPTYAVGRVCIAGDNAHASSPFHGAGVTMGAEDALVLVELLARVNNEAGGGSGSDGDAPALDPKRARLITAALKAYSNVRRPRSQWLVNSSREIGDMYQFRYEPAGRDGAKFKAEFETRTKVLWDFDVDEMVVQAGKEYEAVLAEGF